MGVSTVGCWYWKGGAYPNGYGRVGYNGREICAHRLSWIIHCGEIPDGLWVLHRCDVPLCVNPNHLFLGTHLDNESDKVSKGRQMHAEGHYAAKLNWTAVRHIRASGRKGLDLARDFHVSPSLISMIRAGKVWREAA